MNYTNREVVKRLKQYDMFLSSLGLAKDENTKERICDQLDKIEKQILLETNNEYEEEYRQVLSEEAASFEEEKAKLRRLINIIDERRKYLDERKKEHKKITGSTVELTTFLGEDKLSIFKRRLDIIETYERNREEQENIMNEMKSLDIKISEASRNVKANARLDDILENKMQDLVDKALEKFDLYSLSSDEKEITEKHSILEYALEMAKENLQSAKDINNSYMLLECDNILSEVTLEYNKYHEQLYALKLMDVYNEKAGDYASLLDKREKINDILREIEGSDLYKEISDELSKELNTIRLQKQDLDTYESLKNERVIKRERLTVLEDENNSQEFRVVLDELVKTEARLKEEKLQLAKKKEYQEKQARLLEEQKLEASRRRRQKLIEEVRMKEQHERLSKVKELQDNTVIGAKKEEKKTNKSSSLDKKNVFDLDEQKSILEEMSEEVKDNDAVVEDNTKDLFVESSNPVDLSISFDDINIEDKKDKAAEEVKFDIGDFDDIPVIENNNLKPELLDEKGDSSKKEEKEGDMLWKETL